MRRGTAEWLTAVAWLLGAGASAWGATPLGSGLTYQGVLKLNGSRVNDTCDCHFSLWDEPVAGGQVGPTLLFDAGNAIAVVDGLLTAELDFGVAAFSGESRWLQIDAACPSGSALETLSPENDTLAARLRRIEKRLDRITLSMEENR